MYRTFIISLLVLLSNCSGDKLPRFVTVQGLRVLTLTASDPEINYDGTTFTPATVTLQPWVSDVYGAGRTLEYNLYWCLDPGVGAGAVPTCVGNPTRVDVATAQAVTATASFLAPNYMGALNTLAVDFSTASAPVQALVSAGYTAQTAAKKFNGVAILVFYEIYPVATPLLKVTSFKRILLSGPTKTSKNQNPTGLEIRAGGIEITALPTTETSLEAFLPTSSQESYVALSEQGFSTAFNEVVETTWFLTGPEDVECSRKEECTTDGTFKLSRSQVGELNLFTPPQVATPTARGRVLIAVARDSRGGALAKRYCDGGVLCP